MYSVFFYYRVQLYFHFKIIYYFKFYFNLQGRSKTVHVEQTSGADIMTCHLSSQLPLLI